MPGPFTLGSGRSETGDAQPLQATILVLVEVRDQLFPTALPEEAGRGERRDRQQADTEDANGDLPGLSVQCNLMNEARGKFPATASTRARHERERVR